MNVNIDTVIAKFVALRDDVDRIEKEAKEKKKPIEDAMATLSSALMKLCNDQGVKQFKSAAGTAFITTVSRCSAPGFEETLEHIKATGAYQLLNRAVNKTAVQEYINTHGQPPPGVKWDVAQEIQVRRAS